MKAVLAVCLFLSVTGKAMAHDGATGTVRERMDAMSVMEKALKGIAAMLAGKAGYSPDRVRILAREIEQLSGSGMTRLFPAGSLQKPSEASPTIWAEPDEFKKLAGELAVRARSLAATAGPRPKKEMKTALKRVAANCAACHKTYRIRK